MPFHISLIAMNPIVDPNTANFPALSIASLGPMRLMMQIRLTDTPTSTPVTTPTPTTPTDDEYPFFSSPSPPYSPTTPTPPPTVIPGVVIVLRAIIPKPSAPPSYRSDSASTVHNFTCTPTAPPTPPELPKVLVRKSLPRARYVTPETSLDWGVFSTLPFVFGWGCLPAPTPPSSLRRRGSKRCREEEEGGDGSLGWLVMCRRKKRRTV